LRQLVMLGRGVVISFSLATFSLRLLFFFTCVAKYPQICYYSLHTPANAQFNGQDENIGLYVVYWRDTQ